MKMNHTDCLNAFYYAYKSEFRIWFCYTWVGSFGTKLSKFLCWEKFSLWQCLQALDAIYLECPNDCLS